MEGLLGIDEAAELMGLSSWTLRHLVRMKRLSSVKIGRRILIEREELARFVEQNRRTAAG
jgi:excisionase family DNA binding protein